GISGTNAHLILEQAPPAAEPEGSGEGEQPEEGAEAPGPLPFALSAKSEPALREAAARLGAHLQEHPETELADLAYSLATTRSAFEHRAVAIATDRDQLAEALTAFGGGTEATDLVRGRARRTRQRPVFVFPGQGSQWRGMALELLEASSFFGERMAACEQALAPHLGWSIHDALRELPAAPSMDRGEVVQPILFAVMCSLAQMWIEFGVRPSAVVGHSQGEIAAAHIAGGLTLDEAAMVVARRSRSLSSMVGKGGLVSLALDAERVSALLERWNGKAEIAAFNSPTSTIVAADPETLEELLAACEGEGIRARHVKGGVAASHSSYMEPLREEVLETLATISPRSGEIPFRSTVTGDLIDTAEMDAAYWFRNMRQPVRFQQAIEGLIEQGHGVFLEVGPHPVLSIAVRETIEAKADREVAVLSTLRRDAGGPHQFALALGAAHAHGVEVDWGRLFAGAKPKRTPLPTYPFQRRRLWLTARSSVDPSSLGLAALEHPLLGAAIDDPGGEGLLLSGRISLATHPWLADYALGGTALLPASAFLEIALQAGTRAGAARIEELVLEAPLILSERRPIQLRVALGAPDAEGRREISIHSRPEAEGTDDELEWARNAKGTLSSQAAVTALSQPEWPPPEGAPIELDELYGGSVQALEYGPAFQCATAAWRGERAIYAEVSLADEQRDEAGRYALHPALLDGALALLSLSSASEAPEAVAMPASFANVAVSVAGTRAARAKLVLTAEGSAVITLFATDGTPLAELGEVALAPLAAEQLEALTALAPAPGESSGQKRRLDRRSRSNDSLGERLAAASSLEREAIALDLVRANVAALLGYGSASEVEPEQPFKDLGMDSAGAVELRNRLSTAIGVELAPTLVFDFPSAELLAHGLARLLAGEGMAAATAATAVASDEPIAIVGMACRYPGGAHSPDALWQLLVAGAEGISELPDDRGWDLERIYHPDPEHPGTMPLRNGCFLADVAEFDAAFFGISPREAEGMDPQQRLTLEASWEALEDAGIDPTRLRGAPVGVFAGASMGDYSLLVGADPGRPVLAGAMGSVVSGRVAYALGLEGPAVSIDTACSSSLVSIHMAAQALRAGDCSLALAGGVTVMSTPVSMIDASRMRMVAPDGRCRSFADGAEGTAFSEGVGMLALEPLGTAHHNGHRVLAVLKGSAVNQDGASNGLTAPNGRAQERVMRQALANAGVSPEQVDVVEAHGTGTPLGDPIEAGAVISTYGEGRDRPLYLGSIKSNIGHAASAAGVAGVIKMTMAIREGLLPRTLHVETPSSRVDWSKGRVELLTDEVEWQPNGRPRRAAVSSFGMSGTNSHLILEEPPRPTDDGSVGAKRSDGDMALTGPVVLPISAKTEAALRESASRLESRLRREPHLDPADLAYSLATTRPRFERRAAVLAPDRDRLLTSLAALAEGSEDAGL
ncbi:MAG TPA: beta-ketoacyl synthase N-terminal-like domain-containing protein, partial [Solirubrobacterales bacterium]|nr:beta-ketoacyl synthase N-terminal-like domain-containing protein [Solirubrobacterales bacterium]